MNSNGVTPSAESVDLVRNGVLGYLLPIGWGPTGKFECSLFTIESTLGQYCAGVLRFLLLTPLTGQ